MITLVVTGVDHTQLAQIPSSANLRLIATPRQKQEGDCPREKIQTQS